MPIQRTYLQQMAQSAYSGKTKLQIGPFSLIHSTPTLKFYLDNKLIVVAIRGTQDNADLQADAFAIAGKLGDSDRYKKDLETLKLVQSKLKRPEYRYIAVAHSLGGAILDRFLRANLIQNGLSYNPLPEPQELRGNPLHKRIYNNNDPIYKVVGHLIPNVEVRNASEPFWKYWLRFALPFNIGNLFEMYNSHKIRSFKGGKKILFSSRLEQMGIDPQIYLDEIKRKMKEYGYDPNSVSFADNGIHKLEIVTPQDRIVRFGRAKYNDFLIWSHLEENKKVPLGSAKVKQNRFLKSHSAMKGDWKKNDYSPNWLSMRLLW